MDVLSLRGPPQVRWTTSGTTPTSRGPTPNPQPFLEGLTIKVLGCVCSSRIDATYMQFRILSRPAVGEYGRVILDACLMLLLIIAMFSSVGPNSDDPSKSIHLHEVPIYLKSPIDLGASWVLYDEDNATKHTAFQASVNSTCEYIADHPMCKCIAETATREGANSCLLSNAIPAQYTDWNMSAVSFCLFIWFSSALATSVGTLQYLYVSYDEKNQVVSVYTHKWITRAYAVLCVLTVVLPLMFTIALVQWNVRDSGGLWSILMWGGVSVFSVTAYNHLIIYSYFFNTPTSQMITEHSKKAEPPPNQQLDTFAGSEISSMRHFIFYVNLLISAPAIATLIHLTLGWAEYTTIINTTLLMSSMFAVDAFSAEMVNLWSILDTVHVPPVHMPPGDNTGPDAETEDARRATEAHVVIVQERLKFDLRFGMMRMCTFVVNATFSLLFLTLQYPVNVDKEDSNYIVFVLIVVSYGAMFLLPDLFREFVKNVSFQSTQFRHYGDTMLRCLVLFFVWRASSMGRV